jgi:hypothetical protein
MPSRIRYLWSSPISRKDLRGASDALCHKEYSEKEVWGFIDVHNEGDALSGTFVERFETEDEITDPYGRITVYRRTQFSQTKFRLGLVTPQLELYDAPRSFTPLLTELSSCFRDNLSFSGIHIELHQMIKALKRDSSSLTLLAATLQDITLAPNVLAKISVVGGAEITPYLKVASLGKSIIFEKVCLSGTNLLGSFKIEVSSDGRIQILNGYNDALAMTLRVIIEKSLGEM